MLLKVILFCFSFFFVSRLKDFSINGKNLNDLFLKFVISNCCLRFQNFTLQKKKKICLCLNTVLTHQITFAIKR
jgi:hypothetical protein